MIADRLYGHLAFTVILMPFIGFYAGLLLLAIAIWRSRTAMLWVPTLIVAGIVIEFFGPPAYKARVMFFLFLIAFGWVGVKVLGMEDSSWHKCSDLPAEGASV